MNRNAEILHAFFELFTIIVHDIEREREREREREKRSRAKNIY